MSLNTYSNEYDETLLADYVAQRPHNAVKCPACLGGKSGEASFRLSAFMGGLFGKCFRASCGFTYSIRDDYHTPNPAPSVNPYSGALLPLDRADALYLEARYGTNAGVFATADSRYAIEIRDCRGNLIGHSIRVPPLLAPLYRDAGYSGPKALTHRLVDQPMMSWHGSAGSNTALLVEDQFSAMRAASFGGVLSVALLGTQLNAERVAELQRHVSHIVLALDADATSLAFEHARNWGHAFRSFRVLVLKEDIKDAPLSELVGTIDRLFRD